MKELLRKKHNKLRGEISPLKREKEEKSILKALFSSGVLFGAKSVFIYNSIRSEVSTKGIIEELIKRGYEVYLPKITGKEMKACKYSDIQAEGAFGVKEPVSEDYSDEIDVTITPLLAADRQLNRIGYGGGYYDRFFEKHDTIKVGICFSCQIEDKIDIEKHDKPLDYIISGDGKIYKREKF